MKIKRRYTKLIGDHFKKYRQMIFLVGPRQSGKTTICKEVADHYLDWDNENHRDLILQGPDAIADKLELHKPSNTLPIIAFDEIHKYSRWKIFLKGFFDTWGERTRIIVTGSTRLDIYQKSGDSLMGRYFIFHLHPFSPSELVTPEPPDELLYSPPRKLDDKQWETLLAHGGFPEPFIHNDMRFTTRWRKLRHQLLFKEDIRDLTRIQELSQMESLGLILAERSGEQLIYSQLAGRVRINEKTARNWIEILSQLHFGFTIRPWFTNVERSLRKEPKWFIRDWSLLRNEGNRAETLIACHLLKSVDYWNDQGLGDFALHYIRDKNKREVDFAIIRDGKPWCLIEVKLADTTLSKTLKHFHKVLEPEHSFQVVLNEEPTGIDLFKYRDPIIVSARDFLGQIL